MLVVQRLPERTPSARNAPRDTEPGGKSNPLDSDPNPGRTMSSTLLASPARSVDHGGDLSRRFNGRADATDDTFTSHVVVEGDVGVVRVARANWTSLALHRRCGRASKSAASSFASICGN